MVLLVINLTSVHAFYSAARRDKCGEATDLRCKTVGINRFEFASARTESCFRTPETYLDARLGMQYEGAKTVKGNEIRGHAVRCVTQAESLCDTDNQ